MHRHYKQHKSAPYIIASLTVPDKCHLTVTLNFRFFYLDRTLSIITIHFREMRKDARQGRFYLSIPSKNHFYKSINR